MAEANERQAIEADRQWRAALPRRAAWWEVPDCVHPATAMLQAAKDAEPPTVPTQTEWMFDESTPWFTSRFHLSRWSDGDHRFSCHARHRADTRSVGVTAVASVNINERCISVRYSELASGYQRMFWKQAFRALQSAEQRGWSNHRTVWASTRTEFQAAYATAGDADFGGTLRFTFGRGETSFQELIVSL
jgi:hypothetical protein